MRDVPGRHFFCRHVLRRAEDWLQGERVLSQLSLFEQAQWWPRDTLDAYRLARLRELAAHAYLHVPFYRRRFASVNMTSDDIRSLSDLSRLPVLTRDDLRQHCDADLRSESHDFSRCCSGSSSGSSGDPIVYYKDACAMSANYAAMLVGRGLSGWQMGDATVVVWGNYTTVMQGWSRPSSRLKARLHGETRIPAFQLTTADAMQRALRQLKETRAQFLSGYTNAIYALALEAQKLGIRRRPPFRGVLTTAETLTSSARDSIQEVFGPVYDGYGCGEIYGAAYQCQERDEYHVIEPLVIVELEDIGLGQEKNILLTDLSNYAMPLIRYRIGDIGVAGKGSCGCGRTWHTLKTVAGRTSDIISTPRGGKLLVPSGIGSGLLREVKGICQYQVALVEDSRVVVRVVPSPHGAPGSLAAAIERYLEPHFANAIDYSVEMVDRIPVGRAGKHKIVVDERQGRTTDA